MISLGYVVALLVFCCASLGIGGIVIHVRQWIPLMYSLGLPPIDRGVARRVLFRGVVNCPEELRAELARCRRNYLLVIAGFFLLAIFLLGLEGTLYLGACFAVTWLISKPIELKDDNK